MPKDSHASFVATIDLKSAEKLRQDLVDRGFVLTKPQYTLFSAKKPNLTCTLYASGKLVVQGKDKEEFVTFYLEPHILGTAGTQHYEAHIGVDEAGKGDFFGPLCIGAVYADSKSIQKLIQLGIRDSKTISDRKIAQVKREIQALCPHTVVRIFPERYNALYASFRNLNRLLAWGHAKAIEDLHQRTGCPHVTIDQFANHESVVKEAVAQKNLKIVLEQRHKAESDPVVAAASILARAAFLEGLHKLSQEIGITLPKGASQGVVAIGKQLVAKWGEGILARVAKLHFKTKNDVLGLSFALLFFFLCSSFYMVTDYRFVQRDHPVHLAGQYRDVGKASFYSPHAVKHSKQTYADAFAYAYATHFVSPNNSLTWQAGWSQIHFHWPENPHFRGEDYPFASASLAWISTAIKDWRWIVGGATTVDATSFNFGRTGVYYGLLWGRYAYTRTLGLHVGTYAYYGVRNGYALPILGFDWRASDHWALAGIFPMHTALEYHVNPYWSFSLQGSAFGIPYRFPMRAKKGIKPYEDAIFEIFSTGAELDLRFTPGDTFFLSFGGGWNFGGWILIKDSHNRHGRYFKFNGAPYAQAQIRASF